MSGAMIKRLCRCITLGPFGTRIPGFSLLCSMRNSTLVHSKLFALTSREEFEESVRDFLPPKPLVPPEWQLYHVQGSNRFDLLKVCEIRQRGEEQLHIVTFLEQKEYEKTYRMDNGEREEQEFLNFHLFLKKVGKLSGGLEFTLTSIDMELVVDSLTVHKSDEKFFGAKKALGSSMFLVANAAKQERDNNYRGPMLSELDDDLTDEILDYLDERGINNAFAEYLISQAHFFEQSEYLTWLSMLKRFAK